MSKKRKPKTAARKKATRSAKKPRKAAPKGKGKKKPMEGAPSIPDIPSAPKGAERTTPRSIAKLVTEFCAAKKVTKYRLCRHTRMVHGTVNRFLDLSGEFSGTETGSARLDSCLKVLHALGLDISIVCFDPDAADKINES